jgi:hypothetical protein
MDIYFSVKRGLLIITCRPFFGSKREEVTGDWRILHSDELHGINSHQLSIIQLNKSRRMRRVGHVACMREKTNADRV